MNDPFSAAPVYNPNTSPSPGVGVDVIDAPDHVLKQAAIKLQLGQQLSRAEVSRLATRQSIEQETARQNIAAGDPNINAGRSIANLTIGTGLDSNLAGARVRAAQLASNPLFAAQEQARAEANRYGMQGFDPTNPLHQDALANERVNQNIAASTGSPIELVRDQNRLTRVPSQGNELAPAVPAAPVVEPAVDTTVPSTPAQRAQKAALDSYGTGLSSQEAETDREFKQIAGGRTMTVMQAANLRASIAAKHQPVASTIEVADPLSGDIHQIPVLSDKATGKPYSFTGPATFKTAGVNKTIDTEFQKDYNDWVVNGDSNKAKLSISNLQSAAKDLTDGTVSAASGPMLSLLPHALRVRLFPTASNVQTEIETETIKGLKALFGARVAVSEMQNTLSRTFDPALPQAINAQRALKLADTIKAAADAKDVATKYFQDHGTLGGYKGPKVPTLDEVVDIAKSGATGAAPVSPAAAPAVNAYLSKFAAAPKL